MTKKKATNKNNTSEFISIPETGASLSQRLDFQERKITDLNNVLIAVILVFLIAFIGFVVDAIRFHGENTIEFKRFIQENHFATDEVRLLRIEVDKLRNDVKEIQNKNTEE